MQSMMKQKKKHSTIPLRQNSIESPFLHPIPFHLLSSLASHSRSLHTYPPTLVALHSLHLHSLHLHSLHLHSLHLHSLHHTLYTLHSSPPHKHRQNEVHQHLPDPDPRRLRRPEHAAFAAAQNTPPPNAPISDEAQCVLDCNTVECVAGCVEEPVFVPIVPLPLPQLTQQIARQGQRPSLPTSACPLVLGATARI